MVDENTVLMAIGENRSLANPRENPKAVFCFFEPAPSPYDWKRGRVYMTVAQIERDGATFDRMVGLVRQAAGNQAADNVRAAVTFAIDDARPVIDMS